MPAKKPKPRRPGRPKSSSTRGIRYTVRVSDEESDKIEKALDRSGMSFSNWAREKFFGKP